jgi:hypothetical protein
MDSPLPAWLPFEVLHGIRHIDVLAIDPCSFKRSIENLSGGPYEWLTRFIFLVTRLLSDEHHLGLRRTLAEHSLRS